VLPDCTLPDHPEVFVVGDLMALDSLPGLAEVALQSGLHAAAEIHRRLDGDTTQRKFRYIDLGTLAAISRYYAVGQRGRVHVWGFAGWFMWLVVHLVFLTGFKNPACRRAAPRSPPGTRDPQRRAARRIPGRCG
jgi:NADH:ubiquinone reductase (H+-translocating)